MPHFEKTQQSSSVELLNRFYGLFVVVLLVLVTVGVPFVFVRKTGAAIAALVMLAAVLACWWMSRRGQPEKSLMLFATGLWLLLVVLLFAGLPPTTAMVLATAVILAVVVHLRSAVIFGVSYALVWLLYIALKAADLAPVPYFPGTPLTQWIIFSAAIWC